MKEKKSFNSQPPEGGWKKFKPCIMQIMGFNSQPPEGGWLATALELATALVSTHSRPKAAGLN